MTVKAIKMTFVMIKRMTIFVKRKRRRRKRKRKGSFKNPSNNVEIPFTIDTNILNDITMLIG